MTALPMTCTRCHRHVYPELGSQAALTGICSLCRAVLDGRNALDPVAPPPTEAQIRQRARFSVQRRGGNVEPA